MLELFSEGFGVRLPELTKKIECPLQLDVTIGSTAFFFASRKSVFLFS